MVKPLNLAAVLLALGAHWAPAAAQNVYRCGESYSNQPCPGATVVPAEDPRSAVQRKESEAATRRDARSAQILENERLKQEGKPAQATIPLPATDASAPLGQQSVLKGKVKKPELFTAVEPRKPGTPPAKKKKMKKKAAKKTAV